MMTSFRSTVIRIQSGAKTTPFILWTEIMYTTVRSIFALSRLIMCQYNVVMCMEKIIKFNISTQFHFNNIATKPRTQIQKY